MGMRKSEDTNVPTSVLDKTSWFNKWNKANRKIPEFLLTTTKSTTTALWKCQEIIKISEFKPMYSIKHVDVFVYCCIPVYISTVDAFHPASITIELFFF